MGLMIDSVKLEPGWYDGEFRKPLEGELVMLEFVNGTSIDGYYANGAWRDERGVEIVNSVIRFRVLCEHRQAESYIGASIWYDAQLAKPPIGHVVVVKTSANGKPFVANYDDSQGACAWCVCMASGKHGIGDRISDTDVVAWTYLPGDSASVTKHIGRRRVPPA